MTVLRPTGLALACLSLLSACGGGGDTPATTATQASPSLAGTVAVGAPINQGTLRILDATGALVATTSIAADGSYPAQVLTGPAPYRLEACGYAGANYLCVYSVAQGPGTANVTPLTSATVLLASGAAPEILMSGAATGLSASSVNAAQQSLRTSLSAVLQDADVSASFDFIGGNLAAGSRTGYDRVLDAIGVSTGEDGAHPFVQITPRLGSGNVYIEAGSAPQGSVTVASSASTLSLAGVETLFETMSGALASANACSSGLATSLATNARMSMDGTDAVTGRAAVAAALCQFFAEGEYGEPMWGSKLVSPTLGRCDLTGPAPVCRVSFALQDSSGAVAALGGGMAVIREAGSWKFYGDAETIQFQASARVQRDVRIDGPTPQVSYMRALAFEVPALDGLACARVSQAAADGSGVSVIGYYKRAPGANVRRLSLWTSSPQGNGRSLDSHAGFIRSADDTWIGLPDGAEGDGVVRNFYRGGRSVTFTLYQDAFCEGTRFTDADGRSEFEVDVDGVPPVAASLPSIPWAELGSASQAALKNLSLDIAASADFSASWTGRAGLGVNGITVCADRAACGEDGTGRLNNGRGNGDLRPGAVSGTAHLTNGSGAAVQADSYKMLAIYGRTGDGMGVQSNFISCPTVAAGEMCH